MSEPGDLVLCGHCAAATLPTWQGWPHKLVVPHVPRWQQGGCAVCGRDDPLPAERILWNNVHEPHNTGLPNYWELRTDVSEQKAKWGRPYLDEGPCPRCGGPSIVSEFRRDRFLKRRNCVACGLLPALRR